MDAELDRVAPDLIALGALVVAFAALVTVHVALAFRLGRLGPVWRGLLAILVPPLAPAWGFAAGLRALSLLWLLTAGAYLTALAVAWL